LAAQAIANRLGLRYMGTLLEALLSEIENANRLAGPSESSSS
jgi:hypothetical protein